MNLMDNAAFQNNYNKYKSRVKNWEKTFMEERGRAPYKDDFKEADISIREAYKMYFKLKTQILEEFISFDDDSTVNIENDGNVENKTEEKCVKNDRVTDNDEKEVNKNNEKINETDKEVEEFKNDVNVWNISSNANKSLSLLSSNSSFQLSQTKFKSTKFKKRNPRKSLSSSKLESSLNQSHNHCSNLETSLSQPLPVSSDLSFTSLEQQPLNRESQQTNHVHNTLDDKELTEIDNFDMPIEDDLKIKHLKKSNVSKSINITNQLINEKNASQNIKDGKNIVKCKISDFIEEDNTNITNFSENAENNESVSDEEDYILNSDTEEERKSKRIRNNNKLINQVDTQDVKRFCTDSSVSNTNNDNEQNIEADASSTCKLTLHSDEDEFSLAEHKVKKAKKKQAKNCKKSTTINDNFVRINLKKKVYIRGHKKFNFSRYKKNQWKQRKKMNSEEGNLCYHCNESGHLAAQCPKNQLLPLNDEEKVFISETLEDIDDSDADLDEI